MGEFYSFIFVLCLSFLITAYIVQSDNLSPFKSKAMDLGDEIDYRSLKGFKPVILYLVSPINICSSLIINEEVLFFTTFLFLLFLYLVGFFMQPKLTVNGINELVVSPSYFKDKVNIHLYNVDDSFSRSSYRKLDEVLTVLNEYEYKEVIMTSPIFSKGGKVRDFKLLNLLLSKKSLEMEYRVINSFELLLTRLAFNLLKLMSRSSSMKKTGEVWVMITIRKV